MASHKPSQTRLAIPFKLRGRWSYVSPTRHGWIFFIMLIALLLGSINHNSNLGYILTFLLGSIALVSLFHTLRNIAGLHIISARAQPVFAGQKATFAIHIDPHHDDKPGMYFSFSQEPGQTVSLRPGERQTVSVYQETQERGTLSFTLLNIFTSFPLGLFLARTSIPVDATCLVYPRPVPGPMITYQGSSEYDSGGDAGGEGVEDFAGLEVYQDGDPLQHISWKAFSRGQGLYTKKFEGHQGKTIMFNPDALPGHDYEKKLSRICSMLINAEALRLVYGLHLGSRIIEAGQGDSHFRQCLAELALTGKEAT